MLTCPKCGVELPAETPAETCPNCILSFALGDSKTVASGANDPTVALLPARKMFGDYELLEEIARGGMGIVYRARQVSLNRIVAVKSILAGATASKEFIQRFRTEAAAAASLQHPNIVAIHEVGFAEGQHFFAMDYVEGVTLSQLVAKGPLSAQRAAAYLKLIADAIHFAHERNVLHRDLKPSNVLIDSATDQPRVTDFGLAKRLEGESDLTLSGQVLGSPNYMSPEQVLAKRGTVGKRSDVYSLGAILYHLLTGRPPFQGETLTDVLHQVVNNDPLAPHLLTPRVPRDLETICLKCLEKEPGKRYSTAETLAGELRRFLHDEPIHARPVTRAERAWRWCRRKPALAGSLTMAALLMLVVSIGSPLVALHFKRARQETALNLYAADIKGASVALEEHDLSGARKLLEQVAASPDQRKLRGWEWHYLMDQCRSDELATLGAHDQWVEGVAFSPDDKVLATISGDGVVKLWDWRTRKESLSWQAHKRVLKHSDMMPTHAVMFLPGTSILVTTGADELVHFWNVGSTNPLVTFPSPGKSSGLLACTQDGRLLATRSSRPNQVLLWDISNSHQPKHVTSLPTNLRYVWAVQFLPDGKSLLVSSGAEIIQWWDISDLDQPKRKKSLPGYLSMALSPDGRHLVTGGSHSILRWEVEFLESKEGRPVAGSRWTEKTLLNISPDGRSLVSAGGIGNVMFRDLREEHSPVTLKGHNDIIRGVAFTSDGSILASASLDKTVRLWDVADIWGNDFNQQPVLRHSFDMRALGFSPDSKYLASISWEDEQKEQAMGWPPATLKLWDMASRTEIGTVPMRRRVGDRRVVFSPDGQTLVLEDEGKLHLYSVPELRAVTNWPGFLPAYSQDGSTMVYALTKPNRLVRRNVATGQEVRIGEQADGMLHLALSPDGGTVVTSGDNSGGIMTFWDALGQGQLGKVEKHTGKVGTLAFSPDGQTLASVSADGKLGLWNVADRRNLALLRGHQSLVASVTFSPDGRTVATSSPDTTVRLWNLESRREVVVLRHPGNVFPLAFSPDGQWLATGAGGEGIIRLWHAPTLAEIAAEHKMKKEGKRKL